MFAGRSILPLLARISCAVIVLAVLQRTSDLRLALAAGKEIPAVSIALVMTALALGTLVHVWRGSLTAHILALMFIAGSCVSPRFAITANSDDDLIQLSFGQSYRASDFVLTAILWLAVIIVIAVMQSPDKEAPASTM